MEVLFKYQNSATVIFKELNLNPNPYPKILHEELEHSIYDYERVVITKQ